MIVLWYAYYVLVWTFIGPPLTPLPLILAGVIWQQRQAERRAGIANVLDAEGPAEPWIRQWRRNWGQ